MTMKWRIKTTKATLVVFSLFLLILLNMHGYHGALRNDESAPAPRNSVLAHLPRNKSDGFCRELIESAELIMKTKEKTMWKVHMVQLVGEYKGKNHFLAETMERNYRHNSRMLTPHGIDSTAVREPVEALPHGLSPAFWKMDAVKHYCIHNDFDLVFFLDGDTIIMDPYARVEFLWAYHNQLARANDRTISIDMLFNGDRNELNSGIFIVNCTSKTAIKTLEIWKEVALTLAQNNTAIVHHSWYEQNALHLMMRTRKWTNHGTLQWNNVVSNYTDDVHTYSTESLRQRIRITTQCALNTYVWEIFGHRDDSERFVYKPGHFILHLAGVPAKKKHSLMEKYRNSTQPAKKRLTLQGAARLYLKHHAFRIDRTLAYDDWRIVLDWNHVWPDTRT